MLMNRSKDCTMTRSPHALICLCFLAAVSCLGADAPPMKTLKVVRADDFEITGDGTAASWKRVEWEPLAPRGTKTREDATRVKALYSSQGLYFLMQGADRKVTSTMKEDFADLWKEDVFEVFL